MSSEADIVEKINSEFKDAIVDANVQRKARVIIGAKKDKVLDLASYLKKELAFDFVVSVCGLEMPQENEFTVVYHFWSTPNKILLTLKTKVSKELPEIQSITPIFESANWHERETHEMWGIKFVNHPDLGMLLLPEDWSEKPPQRKDFTLSR